MIVHMDLYLFPLLRTRVLRMLISMQPIACAGATITNCNSACVLKYVVQHHNSKAPAAGAAVPPPCDCMHDEANVPCSKRVPERTQRVA